MSVLTRPPKANGNRASKAVGGVTQTYVIDDGDKLAEITVGGVPINEYGYDAAGRTTSVITSAGTTTLTYDYESRITGITYPSTATNSFTYNGLDTRVSKTDSAGTKTYRRDGAYVTDPVLSDGSSTFTPGISIRNGGATKFQHLDHQGSLLRQTDVNENVTARKLYDAFGLEVQTQGTMVGPFGYDGGFGYQSDSDSGLMLLGHRYYDASTGRFLTRDPIKDGRNWYTYCANNPLMWVDPAGLEVFLGIKGSASYLIGVSGEIGIVIGDDGTWGIGGGGKVTIGPDVGVGGGPTVKYKPGSPKPGVQPILFADETELSIGPVDLTFTEPGEPISYGFTPLQGAAGASLSVIGVEGFTDIQLPKIPLPDETIEEAIRRHYKIFPLLWLLL